MSTEQTNLAKPITVEGGGLAGIRKALFHPATQDQVFASLPPAIDREKFAALCLDQMQAMFANLAADLQTRVLERPEMILRAAQRTAALGLIPGKGTSECAWIFRKGWRNNRTGEQTPDSIDVMPQWQAFMRLMRQAVGVSDVEEVLVHASDKFVYRNGTIEHEYDPFDPARVFFHPCDPKCGGKAGTESSPPVYGEHGLRGGYLRITYVDGRVKNHMVPFSKIDQNRQTSKDNGDNGGNSPWAKWYVEMVRKTIVRDAAARRVVDWTVDAIERLSALEEAARDSDGETIDAKVSAAPMLTDHSKVKEGGMAALKARLLGGATAHVLHQTPQPHADKVSEVAESKDEAVSEMEECPKCGQTRPYQEVDLVSGNCAGCFMDGEK